MPVTTFVYGKLFESLGNKLIDLDSDVLKVMLCTSTYVPNQDTHQFKSSVTNEATGTGYTAGGATLANVTMTYTAATNTFKLDADDVSWPTSTITARYAVIYDSTPATDATRPVICYIDFGEDLSSITTTFGITFDSAGILTITAA